MSGRTRTGRTENYVGNGKTFFFVLSWLNRLRQPTRMLQPTFSVSSRHVQSLGLPQLEVAQSLGMFPDLFAGVVKALPRAQRQELLRFVRTIAKRLHVRRAGDRFLDFFTMRRCLINHLRGLLVDISMVEKSKGLT